MNLHKLKSSYLSKQIPKDQYIEDMFHIHQYLYQYSDFIKDTDIKKIEIEDGSVIMTTGENIKILCDKNDRRIAPIEILNFGSYEQTDSEMILTLIDKDSRIFDIGANFGWYSLLFSKDIPNAKIYAFEPVMDTFNYLKKNIAINKAKNIKPHNFGFSDKKGKRVLYVQETESGSASLVNLKNDKSAKKITCKMTTVDSFTSKAKLKVDFIKCDVEGSELFVFKGARQTITKNLPIVFTEMLRKWSAKFNYHPNEIIDMFSGLGYQCFFAEKGKLKKITTITQDIQHTNFFFLHSKKHSAKIEKFSIINAHKK